MKPRIQLRVELDTLAHRDTVYNAILNRIAGKPVVESLVVTVDTDDIGGPSVVVDVRFIDDVDRDDLRDWIKDQIQNTAVKNWLVKIEIRWHACTHDEANPGPCFVNPAHVWKRQRGDG